MSIASQSSTRPERRSGRTIRSRLPYGPCWAGKGKRVVVCNLSTSLVVEDAARELGADVVRTPVGEVHVARAILRLAAVIGGEGNGGVMYPALHAGRDAPVAAALLLTLLARSGQRVSELVAAAPRYTIVKAKAERGTRNAERGLEDVYAALRRRFPDASADTQDGLRLAWRDRWLHVRPSNTEPIIRLIAEAPSGATGGGEPRNSWTRHDACVRHRRKLSRRVRSRVLQSRLTTATTARVRAEMPAYQGRRSRGRPALW